MIFNRLSTSLEDRWGSLILWCILVLHSLLLMWGAYWHSPTVDEVAHLPAGIWHLQYGRFDLYRVNPPLVRSVAAIPVIIAGAKTNWDHFCDLPLFRPEFTVGYDFVSANKDRSFFLFTLARWACIPFSLLGGYICFRWARELSGLIAGYLALILWCFSPNILAHAQLITPDAAASAFSIWASYAFWQWLQRPTWSSACAAGTVLGLALLTKITCIILCLLWPFIWFAWPRLQSIRLTWKMQFGGMVQLAFILLLALITLNAGYAFDGSFQQLRAYQFVSKTFRGDDASIPGDLLGNRFASTWLGCLPVPLPRDYVIGMDVQQADFDNGLRISYLGGEFRKPGWWYYYLYALAVKTPIGTSLLLIFSILFTIKCRFTFGWQNEIMLLLPSMVFIGIVSSETGFNAHLRYILPIAPFLYIWISRLASPQAFQYQVLSYCTALALACSVTSSLIVYPHSLSYFNELVGGPSRGPMYLLDSNIDWGQDLLYLNRWLHDHPEARPLSVTYWGMFDPHLVDKEFGPVLSGLNSSDEISGHIVTRSGWFAVSVNYLYGYAMGGIQDAPLSQSACFREFTPIARAGYSIYIYHLSADDIKRVFSRPSSDMKSPNSQRQVSNSP